MKEIKAIIRDYMVDHVIDALEQLREPPGITVTPVRGGQVAGNQTPEPQSYLDVVRANRRSS